MIRRYQGGETSRTCKILSVTRVSVQTAKSPRNGTEKSSRGRKMSPIARPLAARLAIHEDAKVSRLDVVHETVDSWHDVRRVAVPDDRKGFQVFDLQLDVFFDEDVQPLVAAELSSAVDPLQRLLRPVGNEEP